MVTPADVCDAIIFCNTSRGARSALSSRPSHSRSVAMSIALVVYVYRYRGRRMMRR